MGKASKWFKALFIFRKTDSSSSSSSLQKKWSDVKSYRDKDFQQRHHDHHLDGSHHYGAFTSVHGRNNVVVVETDSRFKFVDPTNSPVTVEEVVELTASSGGTAAVTTWNGGVGFSREEWAAVVIQSHFRAYLSRRALRALKGLVKLQALVRGHIVRKHTANMLRRMQALIRAQSRARVGRSQVSESPHFSAKSIQFLHHGPVTPDKFEHVIRARSMKNDQMLIVKRNSLNQMGCRIDKKQGSFARTGSIDDIGKILEIDIGKHYITSTQKNLFYSSDLSLNSNQLSYSLDETCFSSADNSPQLHSASSKCARSRRGPFTPTKSTDGTRSYSSEYSSNYPNYMSYTEAAKAKTRSISAPKLRPQYDMSNSTKRYSRSSLLKGSNHYTNFTSKGVYPGSGRLDRHGMPVRGDSDEFCRGLLHIY